MALGGMDSMGPEGGADGVEMTKRISRSTLHRLRMETRNRRKRRMIAQEVSAAAESMTLNADIAELLMTESGIETIAEPLGVLDEVRTDSETAILEDHPGLRDRAPIVTVMGHVDHGKTTLLDSLRNTSVASGEDGGITQSVGAFFVKLGNDQIVFLDTPGHEAFASMRRCGSQLTDIIVLVIAATDGVRPQTIESIELALSADTPIIIALSKVDTPGLDLDDCMHRISYELQEHGVVTDVIGGNVMMIPVAAPTGLGLGDLSEAILLQSSEMLLKADFKSRGEAIVLESRIDKGVGAIADIVTRWGTMKIGDYVVCGEQFGKIRSLHDTVTGKPMKSLEPSTPARLIGLKEPATPGIDLLVVKDVKRAKQVVDLRIRRRLETEETLKQRLAEQNQVEEEEKIGKTRNGNRRKKREEPIEVPENSLPSSIRVPVLLKAETDGSMEALRYSIDAISAELEEKAREAGLAEGSGFDIVRRGVGPVTASDIDLAKSFGAQIFAFNVRATTKVMAEAEKKNVPVHTQSVIYHLLDDLRALVEKKGPKKEVDTVLGTAKVLQIFEMKPRRRSEGTWIVAGCSVESGRIHKNSRLRIVRDGEVIHKGGLDSLKHFKENVNEIEKGKECGITFSSFQDFQVGDIIESYRTD